MLRLKQITGRADFPTTQAYVALKDGDLREALKRASPVERWGLISERADRAVGASVLWVLPDRDRIAYD